MVEGKLALVIERDGFSLSQQPLQRHLPVWLLRACEASTQKTVQRGITHVVTTLLLQPDIELAGSIGGVHHGSSLSMGEICARPWGPA